MFRTPLSLTDERTPIVIDGSDQCKGCPLSHRRFVPGEGVSPCSLMVVGCSPSDEEERSGQPFQGKTGILVREILRGVGVEDRAYFTNVLKRRPVSVDLIKAQEKGRAPTRQETYACGHHLAREIEKLKPPLILALGSVAFTFLTGRRDLTLEQVHGFPLRVERFGMSLTVLPTYDGGYVMRKGGLSSETGVEWVEDLQSVPQHLERT